MHLYKRVCPSVCPLAFQINRRKRRFEPGILLFSYIEPLRTHLVVHPVLSSHNHWLPLRSHSFFETLNCLGGRRLLFRVVNANMLKFICVIVKLFIPKQITLNFTGSCDILKMDHNLYSSYDHLSQSQHDLHSHLGSLIFFSWSFFIWTFNEGS